MVKVHPAVQVLVAFSVQVQANQQQVAAFLEQAAQIHQQLPLLVGYLVQNQQVSQVQVHYSVEILQLPQKQVEFLEGLVTRPINQNREVSLVQVLVDKLVVFLEVVHLVAQHQQPVYSVQVAPIQLQVLLLILHLL